MFHKNIYYPPPSPFTLSALDVGHALDMRNTLRITVRDIAESFNSGLSTTELFW